MIIITQRQLIQAVAKRWRQQYQPFRPDAILHGGQTKQEIAGALDKLDGDKASADDVNAIIGNTLWTRLACDECKEDVTLTVQVGDEPDYESHTAELCLNCAEKAAALIRGMRVPPNGEEEKPREQSGAPGPYQRQVAGAEYHALMLLAREMALELRMRCNEDIHHEQVAEIERRLAAVGLTQNRTKLSESAGRKETL